LRGLFLRRRTPTGRERDKLRSLRQVLPGGRGGDRLSVREHPEAHRPVQAAREEEAPLWREGDAGDGILVPAEAVQHPAALEVPQLERAAEWHPHSVQRKPLRGGPSQGPARWPARGWGYGFRGRGLFGPVLALVVLLLARSLLPAQQIPSPLSLRWRRTL